MSHVKFWSSTYKLPVAVSSVLALMIAFASTPSFANSLQTQSFIGTAYGTSAYVGNSVLIGQTAPVTLGGTCGTSQQPLNVPGTQAGVNLAPLVTGGAVNTDVSDSGQTAAASADTVTVSLLGGLIAAQELKAVSTTTMNPDGTINVSAAGTAFSGLTILGLPYGGNVPANTRVDLPLLGYVVLNEQTFHIENAMATMTVNMIHVHVTLGNLLGLQVGTEIVVSSATSGIVKVFAPAILNGQAFGTEVDGNLLASTPTAPAILPCLGTGGHYITKTLGTLSLPGILSSGTISDAAESNLTETMSSGQTLSTVQGLNILNGLIKANVMLAQVNAVANQGGQVFSAGVDRFIGLSIAGHPEIGDNVPYNTQVNLVGLGTLYLKRILRTNPPTHSIEVRSLELQVLENNNYGLPIGLDVIVGDAQLNLIPAANP
jgi:hypothetical protein